MANKGFYTNSTDIRFLDKIITNLNSCKSFDFSVSFIKKAGLVLVFDQIKKALERGAKGRIITSTYQNFTDIASLLMFVELQEKYPSSFECHLDHHSFGDTGFHTKGYIFDMGDHHEVIVGSSNITRFALLLNKEWDVSVETDPKESFYDKVNQEFDYLWANTEHLNRELIRQYSYNLEYALEKWDMDYFEPDNENTIRPNLMQKKALKEIRRYRDMGANKALVVAATGSGKTYLAAFDALNMDARKLLFIVHKDVILEEALKTFARVFGTDRTYGIYTSQSDGVDKDFVFASNQMMSRHLDLFSPDEFDYIVIDEVHHAAAGTYRQIIDYFKPQFLLGLTATPERMDGENVYELFGNNVPYDLRLREALENDLVVPFHYYGIKDSLINYGDINTPSGIRNVIREISSQMHCNFIREQIEKYRNKEGKLKCVGFCKNVEHARLMAMGMAEQGYHTQYLSAANTTGERIRVLNDLQDDNNPLEIVFAVDIMNEGVDVPAMNMVLFLRPTESSTIFIQQLGRGLRKYEGKEFLTVLDFIANSYDRSAQISMALGTLSKNGFLDKTTMKDYIRTDFTSLGLDNLVIHFDEESKDEILRSIDKTNFNAIKFLEQDYKNFKAYLKMGPGEYPMPTDFLNSEVSADLMRFMKVSSVESYYDFLLKVEENVPQFSKEEADVIRTISWYLPLIRPDEFLILKSLIDGPKTVEEIRTIYDENHPLNVETFEHALNMLQDLYFYTKPSSHILLVTKKNDKYQLTFDITSDIHRKWIMDLLNYGIDRYDQEFYGHNGGLMRYQKYTNIQWAMALNNSNIYIMTGVTYTNKGLVLTINLNKDSQRDERLKYKDRFLSNKVLQWESKTGTTLVNKTGQKLLNVKKAHIFVRKIKKQNGEDIPFTYLGMATLTNPRVSDNPGKCLLFDLVLDEAVPEVYKYDFGIEDSD